MNIQALDNMTPTASQALLARSSGDEFQARLAAETSRIADAAETDGLSPERSKALRTAAEQLVATTFIQPMLAKMREDPFKTDLFHGGQAEEIFGQQMDTIYAERIVAKANFAIVDAVYKTIADSATRTAAVDLSAY